MSEEESNVDSEFNSAFVKIKHKGRERKFEVRELSGGLLDKLSAPLTHQDAAKRSTAVEKYGSNVIASAVYENGKRLTFDEAYALPGSISKALVTKFNELNGTPAELEVEEAKNA